MGKKILVVEDEPAIADNITYALETEGFEAICCATVEDGKAELDKNGFALIILDIGLPDGSGLDLCREIRETSRIPIIFLTARADEVDRVVGLEIGGDDYIVKPFSPRELSARVKAVLRRTEQGSEPEPAVSTHHLPFATDAKRMVISFHGEPLDLSRYEYRLLELFIKRPGWVFSRDQLMEQVWEEPDASLDRTVDTHIKTLRAKLRKVKPDENPIQTHRGLGYSLKESP